MAVGWMVGSGRSGTTWLASLINADHTMREVFEPVHPLFFPKHITSPAEFKKQVWLYWLERSINSYNCEERMLVGLIEVLDEP